MKKTITVLAGICAAMLIPATVTADACEFEIEGNDRMQFDTDEMHASSDCDEITVRLTHAGTMGVAQMGHNWVLTRSEEFPEIARAGQGAGLENDYLPADRSAIIAATEMIGGGETTSVTFDASKLEAGEEYTFYCSFPGHWGQMRGEFRLL